MACTGLATKFISKLVSTSCRLAGGTCSMLALTNISSVGNKKLAPTAVSAAKKVPNIYIINTGLTYTSLPLRCWLIAAMTKIKTNIGATAFSAPTNSVPNRPSATPIFGASQPIKTPNIKPIIISGTSPIRWYIAINERIYTPSTLSINIKFIIERKSNRRMVAFF